MGRIIAAILGVAFVVLVAAGMYMLDARQTDEFTVLGETAHVAGAGGERMPAGAGLEVGPFVSNATLLDEDPGKGEPDRYVAAHTSKDANGNTETTWVRFAAAKYVAIDRMLVHRVVANGFGTERLRYDVGVAGAVSPDGKEYCFEPKVTVQGPATFSLRCTCEFDESAHRLLLHLAERLGSKTTRVYDFAFTLAGDGAFAAAAGH